ncbi:MAG: diguanylate cyclase [Gammaproteobacteria bacterium]|nr:diguanylate cyclase [Gammaproteobacteria bacterium]NNF60908.1 diguanylate cyclase [Gammaproteobacteria bacterium]NNM20527.1 diguanylate cyclase [Gammaproteobacteria bacterium]
MNLSHYLLFVAAIAVLLIAVWQVQRRRLQMEADYRHRLEHEVRNRTSELAQINDDLTRANERLLEASLTDPLTGLRNRRFLFEEVLRDVELIRRLQGADDPAEPVAVFNIVFLMIDLDHFKVINDRCGHVAGDEVLLQVRDILLGVCRSSDFVIRWGGDEFVVVSRNANPDQIEALAGRIRSDVRNHVFALSDGQVVRLTASLGFACYPFAAEQPERISWEQVLGLADSAQYLAKRNRDAWVGYFDAGTATSTQQLLAAIRSDPLQAQTDSLLDIRASFALDLVTRV